MYVLCMCACMYYVCMYGWVKGCIGEWINRSISGTGDWVDEWVNDMVYGCMDVLCMCACMYVCMYGWVRGCIGEWIMDR